MYIFLTLALTMGKNKTMNCLFVCFVSWLFIQENSFNTNVLVSQEAPTYYVHYMFYNILKQSYFKTGIKMIYRSKKISRSYHIEQN